MYHMYFDVEAQVSISIIDMEESIKKDCSEAEILEHVRCVSNNINPINVIKAIFKEHEQDKEYIGKAIDYFTKLKEKND